MKAKYILGVSMSSHDRSAALLKDGVIVAAMAEERMDRRKRSQGFYAGFGGTVLPPLASISEVLREGGISLGEVDRIACTRSLTSAKDTLCKYLPVDPSIVLEPKLPSHHLMHAHAAFATSPFEDAAVLVLDEQGSFSDGGYEKASWFSCGSHGVQPIKTWSGTQTDLSLGLFYNIFAALIGLEEAGLPSAGKLMAVAGLSEAPTDSPGLIELVDDGSFVIPIVKLIDFLDARLEHDEEDSQTTIDSLLKRYKPLHWSTQQSQELAAIAQSELERAVLHSAKALQRLSRSRYLCFGGGIALNCPVNTRLSRIGFDDVFIHPAATDDGNAVGAAFWAWSQDHALPARVRTWSPFLGRNYDHPALSATLLSYELPVTFSEDCDHIAAALAENRVVCWFEGRSEWGPRSLGARSILASATDEQMSLRLNSRVKHREPYRPFAVSWTEQAALTELEERIGAPALSPYMLALAKLRSDAKCRVRHFDNTVRYQLVRPEPQRRFYELLQAVGKICGLEAVLNTSFNILGEPIAETPSDAVRMFLLSGADMLVLGPYVVQVDALDADLLEAAIQKAWRETTSTTKLRASARILRNGYPSEARDFAKVHGCLAEFEREVGISGNAGPLAQCSSALASVQRAGLERDGLRALAMLESLTTDPIEKLKIATAQYLARPGGVWALAQQVATK